MYNRCNDDVIKYMPITILCKVVVMMNNNIFHQRGFLYWTIFCYGWEIGEKWKCIIEEGFICMSSYDIITLAEHSLGKYLKQTLYGVGNR